jgi:hypothetical protein
LHQAFRLTLTDTRLLRYDLAPNGSNRSLQPLGGRFLMQDIWCKPSGPRQA